MLSETTTSSSRDKGGDTKRTRIYDMLRVFDRRVGFSGVHEREFSLSCSMTRPTGKVSIAQRNGEVAIQFVSQKARTTGGYLANVSHCVDPSALLVSWMLRHHLCVRSVSEGINDHHARCVVAASHFRILYGMSST